jgi:ATP-dependent DNA helicase RecG
LKLTDLTNISANRINALREAGINKPIELLQHFPRRYLDRSNVMPIGMLAGQGEQVTLIGHVSRVDEAGFGRKKRLEAVVTDDSGSITAVWFKRLSYFKKFLNPGDRVVLFGNPKRFGRGISIAHPEVDKVDDPAAVGGLTGIFPVYPGNNFFTSTYITSNVLRKWVRQILNTLALREFIPLYILEHENLPGRAEAYRMIHFPESEREHRGALQRFKFEELFLFELSVARLKRHVREKHSGPVFTVPGPLTRGFFNEALPFELTDGQKSALGDIRRDVTSGRQMNRLIQGDVGSGKTVVAIGTMLMAADTGYQSVMMAPTEILAEQHYHTLSGYLKPLGVNIRLLVGSQKAALRRDILSDIGGGTAQIVVGTHAVIQDKVTFANLGVAVIDEQHRFGVMQRSMLQDKGHYPHILVMSATPIPRSLALTLYSDLDLSIITGLPGGRKPPVTAVRSDQKRAEVYAFIEKELADGGQAYIVYPLVEESEAMDLKDATLGYEQISGRFPGYGVGLLHGRMKSDEKDRVMRDFKDNLIQILVSTTVIEVGVDVPNASVMVVEHAERFGLSQLHQLRGRIGRGVRQSYCILMADFKQSKEARTRLATMAETNDGFRIADVDLKLRGPGDFLGTRQSGMPEFRVADIIEDQPLLETAKRLAWDLIDRDPEMEHPEHLDLKAAFLPYLEKRRKFFSMG